MKARDLIEAESAKHFIFRAADRARDAKQAKGHIFVNSSYGNLTVNVGTGKVVGADIFPDNEPDEFDHIKLADIDRFDMKEWIKSRPGAILQDGDRVDILDLGFWTKEGQYEPPEYGWREEHRMPWTGQDQNDRRNWGSQAWEWREQ
jgi:hypothetical protein